MPSQQVCLVKNGDSEANVDVENVKASDSEKYTDSGDQGACSETKSNVVESVEKEVSALFVIVICGGN